MAERISLGTEKETFSRYVEFESERRRSIAKQGRTNPRSATDILERRCKAAAKRWTRQDKGSNPRSGTDV
jgi:hypothetical protein